MTPECFNIYGPTSIYETCSNFNKKLKSEYAELPHCIIKTATTLGF